MTSTAAVTSTRRDRKAGGDLTRTRTRGARGAGKTITLRAVGDADR
ncbi:hypothetical protein HK414_15910 [Ramlibacter terrae]|uniref:ATP-binding protein n=1 Tax=Ramlibacter terrae TaxID=2732511 RepID=A0ABX6P3D5_9BURK|nr:hypothetical protein HK414_15910 [Ramlibacter terrae]